MRAKLPGRAQNSFASYRESMQSDDSGISVIWVAVVFIFLIASAALAIDVSGSFGAARTDQNTADLSCLAGVRELPDETAAINTAVAYIDANWPEMTGSNLTITLPTAVYSSIGGNSVFIDADYGGGGDTMYIETTEIKPNSFAGAVGQQTTTVTQDAACSGKRVHTGTGMLPIGALAGSWNGDLFDCAGKVTGNCGALSPQGGGGSAYRDAVGNGVTGNFLKHHGDEGDDDLQTGEPRIDCFADPCNATKTETGNMVGPFRQGLGDRFAVPGVATCTDPPPFNCDSINDVFGGTLETLDTAYTADPSFFSWWEPSLYGDIATAKLAAAPLAEHFYYNDELLLCDSPRLATIPIVNWPGNNKPLNWDIGDAPGTLPNGKKFMKIIGFYTIYIREPNTVAEIGSGPMEADVIWFGPDAKCDGTGDAFQPFGSPFAADAGVKLVAP